MLEGSSSSATSEVGSICSFSFFAGSGSGSGSETSTGSGELGNLTFKSSGVKVLSAEITCTTRNRSRKCTTGGTDRKNVHGSTYAIGAC